MRRLSRVWVVCVRMILPQDGHTIYRRLPIYSMVIWPYLSAAFLLVASDVRYKYIV